MHLYLIFMAVFSWILNRLGDIVSKPKVSLLEDSHSQLQKRRTKLQAAIIDLRKRFDYVQYPELRRYLRDLIAEEKISPKESIQLEALCGSFLSISSDEIEVEKKRAFELVRSGKDRKINLLVIRLAATALEIAEKNKQIGQLDTEINELKYELLRLREAS